MKRTSFPPLMWMLCTIFQKVKYYLFHWKFAFPSVITVYVFIMKNLVPVTHIPSQIYLVTQSKDSCLKWCQTWVGLLITGYWDTEILDRIKYFSNAPRIWCYLRIEYWFWSFHEWFEWNNRCANCMAGVHVVARHTKICASVIPIMPFMKRPKSTFNSYN